MIWYWFIDGVPQGSAGIGSGVTGATQADILDTTQFTDGPHVIGLTTYDNQASSCTTYTDGNGFEGAATEWTATVNFSNGNTPMEVRESAHEVFLAPGGTYTLTPTLVNTNGTTATSPTFDYYSQTAGVCTVGSSTGASSVVTAVSNGNCIVRTLAEVNTGTHLSSFASQATVLTPNSDYTVRTSDVGKVLRISSSTGGWVPGLYEITSAQPSSNIFVLSSSPCPGASCTNGSFALGPSRTTWVFVAPSNILPHFGTDGSILTSYNPAKSFFMHEGFNATYGLYDQPYNTPNTALTNSLLGYGDDYNLSGYNTLELDISNQDLSQTNQTNFQNGQTSYINGYLAAIAPWPKFRFFGTADNVTTAQMYYATRGASASFTTPAVQYIFQGLKSAGNFIGVSWADEISGPWGPNPLQGPIQFHNAPTLQSGLTSITSSGTSCTANWTNWVVAGGGHFIIHGATTAGFNNAIGSTYTPNNVNANQFTFSCTVASGTYNASTDPGLTIEPISGPWIGSDYIHYDAWATLLTWVNGISGHTPVTGSNPGQTTLSAIANWSGNGAQSIGAITQVGNWADLYFTHVSENYISARSNSYLLISDSPALTGGFEEGYWTRFRYGYFNPLLPITILTQGTSAWYGQQGYQVPISSIANGVITFSAPHNLSVVIPGISRLWITGSSNSAYNTNFKVNGILSPTQLSVSLAQEDFTGTSTGGTITFANGDTKGLSTVTATNSMQLYGDTITYSGSPDNNVPRHRGQTFTISGTAGGPASTFNSRTFYVSGENLSLAQDGNGDPQSYFFFREMPTGSSTGGTASIVADNNFVKGRNGSWDAPDNGNANHPGFGFVTVIESAILRGAGQRMYNSYSTVQGYYDHTVTMSNGVRIKGGWQGQFTNAFVNLFQDTTHSFQLYASPHWENGLSAQIFHADSIASLLINVNQKYILQPSLNSPDFGSVLDCAARAGSYGDILMCVNGTEGAQTRTFTLTPYLQSGQQIVRYIAGPRTIAMTVLSAGTGGDTVTLNPNEAVFYVFPVNFAGELEQPTIAPSLADVAGATQFAVSYSYDLYTLDKTTTNAQVCTSSPCLLNVNRNIGPIYYRLIYTDANAKVLATSDVQTL
jgi:hypothetical protein